MSRLDPPLEKLTIRIPLVGYPLIHGIFSGLSHCILKFLAEFFQAYGVLNAFKSPITWICAGVLILNTIY